jgi:hypothetical protein
LTSFLWGCVGAIAPEVIRWQQIARTKRPDEWRRASYWAATLLYVAIGGALATLVAQPNGYAAFATGLTAEFAILGALAAARERPPPPEPSVPDELSYQAVGKHRLAIAAIYHHAGYLGHQLR